MLRVPTILLALAALVASGCGDEDTRTTADESTSTTTTAGCRKVAAPQARAQQRLAKPTTRLSAQRTHTVELRTNCGTIAIRLDVRRAPKTAASFASLVRRGFYDDLGFHRVDPGFVIQGGDPQGSGRGGPGYSVVEKPPATLQYRRRLVAMAKTGIEPKGTSGSQFFIVTAEDASLPAEYALVGEVTSGYEAVRRIEATPTEARSERPVDPIVIERATLHSR